MNNQLEQSVLYATLLGHIPYESLKETVKSFTKEGKLVWKAVEWFSKQGQSPPYTVQGVELVCGETFGVAGTPRLEFEGYLREMSKRVVGKEIESILQSASDNLMLLDLNSEVVKQMTSHFVDVPKLQGILEKAVSQAPKPSNLAEEMEQEKEEDRGATRIALGPELRSIQQETKGLYGTWVIGGITGAGKSTLAWQLALLAGESREVLYYDMENTKRVLYERTLEIYGGDSVRAREALRHICVRTEPRTVFRDVSGLVSPGLIVVDSLQKLPASVNMKRETMEDWLAKLDRLKQKGHTVIILSQLNRGEGNYKGTNDIEHTADFGIILENPMDNPMLSDVYIEKNRHGIKRGFLCQLRRKNSWLFTE